MVPRARFERRSDSRSLAPTGTDGVGRLYRYLRENGLLIDANDLWIAATALAFGMPVVTRNEKHFARVPELNVMGYR